ncbi:shikimate dehydrogenase [Sinorhizobium kostiense]|uniref:shikimate dehydrogenase (NADP(+)) n=1 Tax=Sinorhizobium kostiense TaxID=76747 RepID=A0ABS4R0T4_9HYPH|nr:MULTISPECIES: ThiF family adenylyltransferase [Sinorhizobium]MBP2236514.1 shikimate dehydrogenase [Sinorhizobium kostiense]
MMISGTTKIFYMLAHPIGHVRTPEVINPLFAERGIDAVMVPVHFMPEDFATGWEAIKRTRNLGGLVVSVPHKEQAYALSEEVEAAAEELGAANVIRRDPDGRMIATNMDGLGFLRGVLNNGQDARDRDVLLVGAGGAGKAIAFALARSGCKSIRISDVDLGRAELLAEDVAARYRGLSVTASDADLDGADMLVNATPCGLHPETDPLPVDISQLRPDILVADIIMKPRETPLLKAAIARGCQVRYGAGMLDSQIALMVSYFGY